MSRGRISLGADRRTGRGVVVIFLGFLLAGSIALLVELGWGLLPTPFLRNARAAATETFLILPAVLAVALFPVFLLLGVLRGGAWLDGSELTVRGPLTTRSVDLSVAELRGRSHRSHVSCYDELVATTAGGGRVTLRLDIGGNLLPRRELIALADAITTGRVHTGDDSCGCIVANRLREVAQFPYHPAGYIW